MAGAPIGNNNAGRGRQATHALELLIRHFDKHGLDPIDWDTIEVVSGMKTLMRMWEPQARSAILNDDREALKLIVERLDGRPRQALDIGGQEDNPLQVTEVQLIPLHDNSSSTDTE